MRLFRALTVAAGLLAAAPSTAEVFIDIGAHRSEVEEVLGGTQSLKSKDTGANLGLGVRRDVGERGGIGFRVEVYEVHSETLMAVRAFDYAYHFSDRVAGTAFAGVARLDLPTAAYGYYFGGGLLLKDLRPGWDLGVELRLADELARDNLLPDDPRPGFANFYDVTLFTLFLSRSF